jgi:hypothetical protein
LALSLVSRNFFLNNEKNHQIGSGKQPQIEEDQDLLLLLLLLLLFFPSYLEYSQIQLNLPKDAPPNKSPECALNLDFSNARAC